MLNFSKHNNSEVSKHFVDFTTRSFSTWTFWATQIYKFFDLDKVKKNYVRMEFLNEILLRLGKFSVTEM